MNNKEISSFVELLYPYIIKKIKQDSYFKNVVKSKNAIVVATPSGIDTNIGKKVEVKLPYDTVSFSVINETGENLIVDDLICIEYWIDLKNAIAVYKVKK